MPKLSIDDVKRMMTNATVKAQRYSEAANYLRYDRTFDNVATREYYALKGESQRMEVIALVLQKTLVKMQGQAKVDELANAGMAKIIAETKK